MVLNPMLQCSFRLTYDLHHLFFVYTAIIIFKYSKKRGAINKPHLLTI